MQVIIKEDLKIIHINPGGMIGGTIRSIVIKTMKHKSVPSDITSLRGRTERIFISNVYAVQAPTGHKPDSATLILSGYNGN